MFDVPFTIGTKSASPGMYAVPAAPGPTMAATCGTTPLITTCSRNRYPVSANPAIRRGSMSPEASRRAPAESTSHTMGIRSFNAMSRRRGPGGVLLLGQRARLRRQASELLEGPGVEQRLHPRPGVQLAARALPLHALTAAHRLLLRAELGQLRRSFRHPHWGQD